MTNTEQTYTRRVDVLNGGGANSNKMCWSSQYLVSDMGWCSDREAQAQNHAGRLGDETDQIEGGRGLVRWTVEEIIGSVEVQFFVYI